MSATRRREKALDRQANVHRLGICGGPGHCPLWHGTLHVGPVSTPEAPTLDDLAKMAPVRGVESVSYRGRGA